MPKSFRSICCQFLVLSSITLAACNSSGRNSPAETVDEGDDRPTIVSSDAVTIRDNTETDSSDAIPAGVSGSEVSVTADDQVSTSVNSAETSANLPAEIDTIEGLLAQLETRRNSELSDNMVEQPAEIPSVTASDSGGEDNVTIPVADLVTDETVDPVISDNEQKTDDHPSGEPVGATDPTAEGSDDQTENEPVTDSVPGPLTDNNAEGSADELPVDAEPFGLEDVVPDAATTEGNSLSQDDPAVAEGTQDTTGNGSFSSDKNEIVLDCNYQLPCAASNVDGAVAVVVENVYRHPETRRLAIALSVTANRDTALRWDNDITSTDDVANTYNGTTREFSGFYQFDRDNDMVTLLAGTTLLVVQHFREMPLDTTVSMVRFDTGYIEAGVRTALQFSNMPLDPVLGDIVDCADQVPCTWVANDQSYAVNVLKTSGLWQTGRLRIDFEVRSTVGMGLSLFSSEPVVGNDGSVFTPRTHSLSGTSDYQEFTAQLVPEGVLAGHQDFLKNANRQATSLVQVKLGMTRVNAPGAGSPVFRNLPLE